MKKFLYIIVVLILIATIAPKIIRVLDQRVLIISPYIHTKYNNKEIVNYNIFNMTLILKNGNSIKYNIIKKYNDSLIYNKHNKKKY